jgi:hypothetical protein
MQLRFAHKEPRQNQLFDLMQLLFAQTMYFVWLLIGRQQQQMTPYQRRLFELCNAPQFHFAQEQLGILSLLLES